MESRRLPFNLAIGAEPAALQGEAGDRAYSLVLADATTWGFLATTATHGWLRHLAHFMALDVAGDVPTQHTVTFVRASECDGKLVGDAGATEASSEGERALHGVRCLRKQGGASPTPGVHLLCDIGTQDGKATEIEKMRLALHFFLGEVERCGGFVFHGALIEQDGRGVILAAPSGTGKSTQCARLPDPWTTLSDDEAMVIRNTGGTYQAHPLPSWSRCIETSCDLTWPAARHVPVAAVCFLEQAASDAIRPVPAGTAAMLINASTNAHFYHTASKYTEPERRRARQQVFHNACRIAECVPCFILRTSRTGRFWTHIERTLASGL